MLLFSSLYNSFLFLLQSSILHKTFPLPSRVVLPGVRYILQQNHYNDRKLFLNNNNYRMGLSARMGVRNGYRMEKDYKFLIQLAISRRTSAEQVSSIW